MPTAPGPATAGTSAFVERAPVAALADLASAVWVQHVPADGPAVVQRHLPHGGAELRCVLGSAPRLVGPSTGATVELLAPGATVVGVRLHPGTVGHLAGVPASELADQDVPAAEVWPLAPLQDRTAAAGSPDAALAGLQAHLVSRARSAGPPDRLVGEVVRRLMPWQPGGGVRVLAASLSISERQLRRRCHSAVGVGAKELQRLLRFQGFLALVQQARGIGATTDDGLARWAVEAGYADQPHLGHECRRLTGLTPREFLAETARACGCGHDHAASYAPLLRWRATESRAG